MQRHVSRQFTRLAGTTAALAALIAAAAALAGCGSSVNATLLKEAGVHGNALQQVYYLYNQDVLKQASSRDLKSINAALAAGDLKKATPGDVRRAQDEINSRIKRLDKFVRQVKIANAKLKATPAPDFGAGLDKSFANDQFAKAYSEASGDIERYTTADLGSVKLAFNSLEKYLAFLDQWEEFLIKNDITNLVSSGKASDQALARLKKTSARMDRRGTLNGKVGPLVDQMAAAASNSSQLTSLINDLKKNYPKSFLAEHVIEKKK